MAYTPPMITKDRYQVLLEEIRGTREEVARIDRDLVNDRHDLGDFKVRMSSVEAQISELRQLIINMPRKIEDRASDAVQEVTDPVRNEIKGLREIIQSKKFITLKNKGWKFWKFGGGE